MDRRALADRIRPYAQSRSKLDQSFAEPSRTSAASDTLRLRVNGKKSGDGLLAPGWTNYSRTCLYETHDVTDLIRGGENAIGVVLGDGMYHTERRNRFSKFQGTFGPQRAILQLELQYADGTTQYVTTDETWRVDPWASDVQRCLRRWKTTTRASCPRAGTPLGLTTPHGIAPCNWSGQGACCGGHSASAPKIAAIESMPAREIGRPSPSRRVLDFGQNTSFMPRLTVRGPAGSTVRLTHAEVLDDQGQINRRTCGGNRGPAYWQYTKSTDGEETWFPRFFYAGCRYLQADLLPAATGDELPEIVALEGVVVHTTAAPAGSFACSNELLNRIRELVRWGQRSNLVSVLTDCPHREKLGWLEQYHLNGPGVR